MAQVLRPRAKLRYVVESVVLGCMPDHVPPPDDLEKEVEVCLKELDDAKAVDFGGPWIFF